MGKIVLLAVAAAWAAVLLPPLIRSRFENRPGSSVTDFRRQLSTLERTVPTRSMVPMRSIARPLAPSPLQRPAVTNRTGPMQRAHLTLPTHTRDQSSTGELARRVPREPGTRSHTGHRHAQVQQLGRRELIRRRRANVLFVLVATNVLTLFLAATTKSQSLVYAFAFAFVSLCGYCYKLAQIRQYELDARYGDTWFNAA